MARKPRLQIPGGFYHVTTRSIDGRPVLRRDKERRLLLALLTDVAQRFEWLCHVYCLMNTHYHLLVETPKPNIASGMQRLNGLFAQTFNRQHRRSGHVFERRYHGEPLERDAHLLEVVRYIVLNPVRAGLCEAPEEWPWSSYRATVGAEPCPPFLTVSTVLGLFGHDAATSAREYAAFVTARLGAAD